MTPVIALLVWMLVAVTIALVLGDITHGQP